MQHSNLTLNTALEGSAIYLEKFSICDRLLLGNITFEQNNAISSGNFFNLKKINSKQELSSYKVKAQIAPNFATIAIFATILPHLAQLTLLLSTKS
jgi:hypothetical protein